MRRFQLHTGFTLLEILIAMTLVVVVITAVYGTYAASASSIEQCREVIDRVRQGRFLLERMSAQLRCSYVPCQLENLEKDDKENTISNISLKSENYFEGHHSIDGKSDLHFITTQRFQTRKESSMGLFCVAYRYDSHNNELWYSETRWDGSPPKEKDQKNWVRIGRDVGGIGFEYYDGREWQSRWNSDEASGLPGAIRIDLALVRKSKTPMHLNTCVQLQIRSK